MIPSALLCLISISRLTPAYACEKEVFLQFRYAIENNDITLRNRAGQTLVASGDCSLPLLLDQLSRPNLEIRRASAVILGRIGNPQAVPHLILAADSARPMERSVFYHAISKIFAMQADRNSLMRGEETAHHTADPELAPLSAFARVDERWRLYVERQAFPQSFGIVYQPVPSGHHINEYRGKLGKLFAALLDESEGGLGHARRLRTQEIYLIRVYELPISDESDIKQTKAIFRRVFRQYGIRVLVGHYAGLYENLNFRDPHNRSQVFNDITSLIAIYSEEPWVLGWQLGNENNYHVIQGTLSERINLTPAEYFLFMDSAAQQAKAEMERINRYRFILLGNGDLSPSEADFIGRMRYFDGIALNVYRHPQAILEVLDLASSRMSLPVTISEFGLPATDLDEQKVQARFLREAILALNASMLSRGFQSQVVLAFIAEATDQPWKAVDLADPAQGNLGVFGKRAELAVGMTLSEIARSQKYLLLPSFSSDVLLSRAWSLLDSYKYEEAIATAEAIIRNYAPLADKQQNEAQRLGTVTSGMRGVEDFWALNDVGAAYLIAIHGFYVTGSTEAASRLYDVILASYPHAHVKDSDGTFRAVTYCVRRSFPELIPTLFLATTGEVIAAAALLIIIILLPGLLVWSRAIIWPSRYGQTICEQRRPTAFAHKISLFLLLFGHAFLLSTFSRWWFGPIRMDHYVVSPLLFWILTWIGGFHFAYIYFIFYLLLSVKAPKTPTQPLQARVAAVTTYVASEPIEMAKEMVLAMKAMRYPHDTYVLDESNNSELATFCTENQIIHFSRRNKVGYQRNRPPFQSRTKGGNLNAWLDTHGKTYDYVTFLDLDHRPKSEYLDRVLGFFRDSRVGFVQAPNSFSNTGDGWIAIGNIQPNYFFVGPVQMGLYGNECPLVNGSHTTFRIDALKSIGLYAVHNADDVLTSLRLHSRNWRGVYTPEHLAQGLMPATWSATLRQQLRWSHSMFDILIFHLPRYVSKLDLRQTACYGGISLFYVNHLNFVILLLLPIISVLINRSPVNAGLLEFAIWFVPPYASALIILIGWGQQYLVHPERERGIWWRSGLVEIASCFHVALAFWKVIQRKNLVRTEFVTPKTKASGGDELRYFRVHIGVILASVVALSYSIWLGKPSWPTAGMRLFLAVEITLLGGIVLSASKYCRDFWTYLWKARD